MGKVVDKIIAEHFHAADLRCHVIEFIADPPKFLGTFQVETVVLLSQRKADDYVEVELELDELDVTSAESKATYEEIKKYVLDNTGLKVSTLNIAQVKQKCGIIERENYHSAKSDDVKQPNCPKEKEGAIIEALKAFKMI